MQTPILQERTSIFYVTIKQLYITVQFKQMTNGRNFDHVKLTAELPVIPFVTRLQFTDLGWTELSSSRKKIPSDKRLS